MADSCITASTQLLTSINFQLKKIIILTSFSYDAVFKYLVGYSPISEKYYGFILVILQLIFLLHAALLLHHAKRDIFVMSPILCLCIGGTTKFKVTVLYVEAFHLTGHLNTVLHRTPAVHLLSLLVFVSF